jgi:hypothetical protein
MADLMSILQANAAPPQMSQGWASVGQALAGLGGAGREQAYDRGVARAAQLDKLTSDARLHREAAMEAEKKRTERTSFVSRAVAAGIPEERAALLANAFESGYDPTKITAFQGGMQEQGFRDNIVAQALAGDMPGAGAYSMGLAKGPLEMTKIADGVAYNPYGQSGQDLNVTPVGQSTIGQRNASAAASYASANNSNASAARTRQATTLDRADTMGGGGSRAAMKAPSGYRWTGDGRLEAIPGGPADKSGGSEGAAVSPKLTEGQSKDLVYLKRGDEANKLLETMAGNLTASGGQQGARGAADVFLRGLPVVGDSAAVNSLVSAPRQQAEQAAREYLAAVLRKDTGAAITSQEFDIYGQTYLPQPGDSPAVLRQKANSRQVALDAIATGLGPDRAAIARPSAGSAAQAFGGSAPQEQRARNPATGQVLVLRNGQWVPE